MDNGTQLRTREGLAQYVDKRIVIEGRIRKYGSYMDSVLQRQVPGCCIQDVEVIEEKPNGGESRWVVTDHVWITFASPIDEAGAKPGDGIRCEVLVNRYYSTDPTDHNQRVARYGLREPRKVEIVRPLGRPVSVRNTPPATVPVLPPSPPPAPVKASLADVLRDVTELVDRHGLTRVEKALAAVRAMTEE